MINKRKITTGDIQVKKEINFLREKFHHIQTSLQFSRKSNNKPLKTIVITSGQRNEGKSFCTWNLAKSLAATNRSVLVVDVDMHKANITKRLHMFNQSGLSDILISFNNPMEYVVETKQSNLFVLPTGIIPPNPIELINSQRMRDIVSLLEKEFDMVIFDTPPTILLSDSRILGSMCDGVIVIIRSGLTKKRDLEFTMELLKKADANVVGTILNGKSYGRKEMEDYSYY
ncbi:capsular exopolysaccharide family protein [Bacillus cereus str. Schrouff]|uniref:CpsD/CapB family tyrosine-protein kinase n=1 Tax=Bacillus cereus TaxID=1396 RepID=UPI00032E592A|nr:CpsD/CapB family tyrosine-protein kinase [Bacillus cereus]EOO04740.1 capsular exopolysaccharide family protein [Bacillus cereus str. Schrouff]EOO81410.1 capsular exopolysaccharide family protein [Bacillus cereus K-5975c]